MEKESEREEASVSLRFKEKKPKKISDFDFQEIFSCFGLAWLSFLGAKNLSRPKCCANTDNPISTTIKAQEDTDQ